jgi:hypothetical protein
MNGKQKLMAVGIRCAEPRDILYPLNLALTSPTSGGSSVGIVRLRTKATEFVLFFLVVLILLFVTYSTTLRDATTIFSSYFSS